MMYKLQGLHTYQNGGSSGAWERDKGRVESEEQKRREQLAWTSHCREGWGGAPAVETGQSNAIRGC